MIETRLLNRLDQKKSQLDELRPLPGAALKRLKAQLEIEWIYNSNAIEGSTLTLRETQLILEEGITIGGKSLREHFEVINHREAIKYVENLVEGQFPITAFQVRQMHKLVLTNLDDENAGNYRTTSVRMVGARHIPPEPWLVPQMMDDWAAWVAGENKPLHPIELAAMAHHQLVAIHPFIDGNGRTARLVMNLSLMQAGYPPTVIMRVNRKQYYNVLAAADAGESSALVNFVGRAVERSLTLYLEALTPRQAQRTTEEEWILLRAAAQASPYSQEYLSLLARQGKLEAVKRGRLWYTTKKALADYINSVA